MEPRVVLISKDLMFRTELKEFFRSQGCEVIAQKDFTVPAVNAVAATAKLILLDLESTEEQGLALVPGLEAAPASLLCFLSHRSTGLADQAVQLGARHVVPRSALHKTAIELLSKHDER